MTFLKVTLIGVFLFSINAFTALHKYYVSVTEVHYVEQSQAVQMISRVFIDDMEMALQNNYNDTIILAGKNESKLVNDYLREYFNARFKTKINGERSNIIFIGKEYEGDVMKCYLEIKNVEQINSIEISDEVLFDVAENQQNIIKTDINGKQKSFILNADTRNKVLNFK